MGQGMTSDTQQAGRKKRQMNYGFSNLSMHDEAHECDIERKEYLRWRQAAFTPRGGSLSCKACGNAVR